MWIAPVIIFLVIILIGFLYERYYNLYTKHVKYKIMKNWVVVFGKGYTISFELIWRWREQIYKPSFFSFGNSGLTISKDEFSKTTYTIPIEWNAEISQIECMKNDKGLFTSIVFTNRKTGEKETIPTEYMELRGHYE